MRFRLRTACFLLSGFLTVIISGCSTTSHTASSGEVHQFAPMPQAQVGASDLPGAGRPVIDLMRDADDAFRMANEAQERGDKEAALRHYQLMLELLVEADLDPDIFYSLRGNFADILDESGEYARTAKRMPHHRNSNVKLSTSGFSDIKVPFPLPERVLEEIERLQTAYPTSFQAALDRSYLYMPHITAELDKAGLPRELAYIAMVESHFTPKIVSRSGAGGMWQFMPVTAKRFHLHMDSEVDARYDWQASTTAAIDYLQRLNRYFDGEWPLAIAAYNMGEGGLERAMTANGGDTNFWSLIETPPASNRIRLETKRYYPKFLAYWIVSSNPTRYGFRVNPVAPEVTDRVPVQGVYALDTLDKVMNYPSGTLARLNPELIRETTPSRKTFALAVPKGQGEALLAALSSIPKMQYASQTYKVRRGDTVSGIARTHGVSEKELMRVNNIRSARSLRTGQTLKMPGATLVASGGAPATPAPAVKAPQVTLASYTVQRGDTLSTIASKQGMGVSELQKLNGMGRSTRLHPGQKLKVKGSASPVREQVITAATESRHTVHAGEYPAKIARDYGVQLNDLLLWNGLGKNSTIHVGDTLLIKGGGNATASSGSQRVMKHVVAKGETASTIAKKYGVGTKDLLAWNQLSAGSIIRVGDTFTIHGGGDQVVASSEAEAPAKPTGKIITHTVDKGHTATAIARRYGVRVSDIYKLNGWSKNHVLHPGDKVKVQQP